MILPLLLAAAAFCCRPAAVRAADENRVAVMPFRVHAPVALDHLKFGLQEMLTLRLSSRGMNTVPPEMVNRYAGEGEPVTEVADLLAVGKASKARWVLGGSVTQIGKKISLDLKVVDVEGRRPPFLIYQVAEDLDALPETADRIAMTLDYQLSGVPQIDSIRVKGNQRIEAAAIQAVIRSKPGDRVDQARLDKDLRSVYGMGFFRDVKIETEPGAKGQVVIFDVTEKPSVGKIVFEGNKEEV